jgi:hypothetical protein
VVKVPTHSMSLETAVLERLLKSGGEFWRRSCGPDCLLRLFGVRVLVSSCRAETFDCERSIMRFSAGV